MNLNAAAGPIVIGSASTIDTSGGASLNIIGTGAVTLGGSITGGGAVNYGGSGQLNINSATALGSGMFTINGGTLGNTSGTR